jgi:hypothetical protein
MIGTIVAPGEPVPGVSGIGAVTCGDTKSRDWAFACTAATRTTTDAIVPALQRLFPLEPHASMQNFSVLITANSSH